MLFMPEGCWSKPHRELWEVARHQTSPKFPMGFWPTALRHKYHYATFQLSWTLENNERKWDMQTIFSPWIVLKPKVCSIIRLLLRFEQHIGSNLWKPFTEYILRIMGIFSVTISVLKLQCFLPVCMPNALRSRPREGDMCVYVSLSIILPSENDLPCLHFECRWALPKLFNTVC